MTTTPTTLQFNDNNKKKSKKNKKNKNKSFEQIDNDKDTIQQEPEEDEKKLLFNNNNINKSSLGNNSTTNTNKSQKRRSLGDEITQLFGITQKPIYNNSENDGDGLDFSTNSRMKEDVNEQRHEFTSDVLAHVFANIFTIFLFALIYLNFCLFKNFFWAILWAFITAQGLKAGKDKILTLFQIIDNKSYKNKSLMRLGYEIYIKSVNRFSISKLFYDYNILLFYVIGIYVLAGHLASFDFLVIATLGFFTLFGTLLFILDRKILFFRYFINDQSFATSIMILLFFGTILWLLLFLGTESVLEGVKATSQVTNWAKNFYAEQNNTAAIEGINMQLREQWEINVMPKVNTYIDRFEEYEEKYQHELWWPIVGHTYERYFSDNTTTTTILTRGDHENEAATLTAEDMYDFVMEQANTVQWSQIKDLFDKGFLSTVATYLGMGGGSVISIVLGIVLKFGNVLSFIIFLGASAFQTFKQVTVYMTCLAYFLRYSNILENGVQSLLPISKEARKQTTGMIQDTIRNVLFLPAKIASVRALITLTSFLLLDIEFPFFASVLSIFFTVIPILPPVGICLPWVAKLFLISTPVNPWNIGIEIPSSLWGTLLLVSQFYMFGQADKELFAEVYNPTFISMSFFLGYAVFGGQGILIGPLVLCSGELAFKALSSMRRETVDDSINITNIKK